jgi:hypothetical protein
MCGGVMSCGTIFVLVYDGFRHSFHRLTYYEIVRAARLLRQVSMPVMPLALMHNERVLKDSQLQWLQSRGVSSLWDRRVTFDMHPDIKPYYTVWAKEIVDGSQNVHGWQSISYWKLSALLQSPFNKTLFLDNDVYVLQPSLVNDLLSRTLNNADIAIPVNVARGTEFWKSAPLPSLCIAIIAFNSNAATRDLFVGAARRLAMHAHQGTGYAGVEQRDQEMLWFEWRATPALRMLPLPEEYYCPDVEIEFNGSAPLAWWQLNWGTVGDANLGRVPCKAVHGHSRYFYRQQATTMVTSPQWKPRKRRSGAVGIVVVKADNGSLTKYTELYKSASLGFKDDLPESTMRRIADPWRTASEIDFGGSSAVMKAALMKAGVSYNSEGALKQEATHEVAAQLPPRVSEVFSKLDALCGAQPRTKAVGLAKTPHRLFGIAAYSKQVLAYMQVARDAALRTPGNSTLVCEIGFNCGHSSVAFLEAHENISVLNFDLPTYSWAQIGRKFMRDQYPGRIQVIDGSSSTTVPEYARAHPSFRQCDVVVIDGGHSYATALDDLQNVLHLAKCNASVLIDDVCDPSACHAHVTADVDEAHAGQNQPTVVGPTQAWSAAKAAGLVLERRAWFEVEHAPDRGWAHGFSRCDELGKPAIPQGGFPRTPSALLRFAPDVPFEGKLGDRRAQIQTGKPSRESPRPRQRQRSLA